MSEKRYGVHDCPNGFYYLRDVTDHSVYIHRNYGYLYSPYKEDIELVSTLLNELADKVDEQQATIQRLEEENDKLIQKNCIPCELVNLQTREIDKLKEENEQLRKQCFELEKDYLIETSDISDKIYLDDEIRELKQRYGV